MISYEIRRSAAVIATKPDASTALAFAELHSHFPGQLKVFAVIREEYEITEPPAEPIPFKGPGGDRARTRLAGSVS
jgi:hypothetical protein